VIGATVAGVALLYLGATVEAQKPRVLLYYDMEGISGIARETQTGFSHPTEYQPARAFLTGDVNAAIRGLIAGGAGEIVVTDAHGSGNPDPDILLDKMDPRAKFEWRDQPFDPYRDVPDNTYRAIVCIGMHARANTPGFLAHTYTIHPSFRLNGLEIDETEIIAHSAARFGTPVIMVSGDDVLQKEIAERFPNAEYGVVKHARSRAAADVYPEEVAWKNIEQAAKRAIEKLATFKPFPVAPAFKWELGWQNEAQTELAMRYPGVTRINDKTVGFSSPDFIAGYDEAVKLIQLSGPEYSQLLMQILRERPEGAAILAEYERRIIGRWLEPEKMPAPPARPKPTGKKRYHGDS
jgi:D-amino peptidase